MKYKHVMIILFLLLGYAPNSQAQISKKRMLEKLEAALSGYLVNVYPHHFCDDNKSRHSYMGQLKIEKTGRTSKVIGPNQFEDRFMVWGLARADYHNGFVSGSSTINFIAQFKELPGDIEVVKLKWKKNDCMQYRTLLDQEADEPEWWEVANTQEDEILEWALEAEETPEAESQWAKEAMDPELSSAQSLEYAFPLNYIKVISPISPTDNDSENASSIAAVSSIEGVILNNALFTTYKYAVLEIRYFSKTQTLLKSEQWILYEFFEPEQEIPFIYPVKMPDHTHRFELSILKAVPME